LTKIGDEKLKIILCGLIKLITNLHVHWTFLFQYLKCNKKLIICNFHRLKFWYM
jgi:hypothetical protein